TDVEAVAGVRQLAAFAIPRQDGDRVAVLVGDQHVLTARREAEVPRPGAAAACNLDALQPAAVGIDLERADAVYAARRGIEKTGVRGELDRCAISGRAGLEVLQGADIGVMPQDTAVPF